MIKKIGNSLKSDFFLLSGANFLFFFTTGLFFFFPVFLAKIGGTKTFIGFMMGLPAAIQIFFGLKIRNKIDFINKKMILLWSSVLGAIVCLGYFLFPSLYVVPILRFFNGFVNAIGVAFGLSIAVDLIPAEKRVGNLGLFGVSGALSTLFAPSLAEFIINNVSHGMVFVTAAIVNVIRIIVVFFISTPTANNKPKENAPVKTRDYISIIPLAVISGAVYSAVYNFISHYAKTLHITMIATFAQAHISVMLSIRLFLNKKMNKWSRKNVILAMHILSVLVLIMGYFLKYYPSIALLIPMGALYGIIHGFMYPSLNTLFIETTPKRSGKATIIFIVSRNIGIAVFSFICGIVADHFGYNIMYLFMAFVALAPVLYIVFKPGIIPAHSASTTASE